GRRAGHRATNSRGAGRGSADRVSERRVDRGRSARRRCVLPDGGATSAGGDGVSAARRSYAARGPAALMGVGALVIAASTAAAQDDAETPPKADPAAAEALFNEGRKLLKEGLVDAACPKFAESY